MRRPRPIPQKPKARQSGRAGSGPRLPSAPVEVPIERLAHDGRGIGYWDGKVTFVEQALPGETHLVRLVEVRSRFQEGISEACVSDPAPERVNPPCPHYQTCGGCQLQHLNLDQQRAHKAQLLRDHLQRAGVGVAAGAWEPMLTGSEWGYRSRARLSIRHKGKPFAGFRQKSSRELVKVSECPILHPELNQSLSALQQVLAGIEPRVLGHAELLRDDSTSYCLLRQLKPLRPRDRAQLAELGRTSGLQVLLQSGKEGEAGTTITDPDGNAVAPLLGYRLAGLDAPVGFQFQDFTQINPEINRLMVAQALAWASPVASETWLDLFCGIGNFTLPLASLGCRVIGVELLPYMVERARQNAAAQGLDNCEFAAADLTSATALRRLPAEIDGVLLDPPRAGAREVVENLLKLRPKKLLYVSCDPATFARDAKILLDGGYELIRLSTLDMFPQTMHVESMGYFEYSGLGKPR